MGFDFDEKRSLLYADLFKLEEGHHGNNGSRRRSPASNCSSSSDSSSSGFATPFGSELGSSESDDGDFAAELSRQMAECMLHEEEEDERNSATESSYELSSNDPVLDRATRTPCIKMKNQFPVGDQVGVWRGGRVKGGELTQRVRTEQNYGRYRGGGRGWRGGAPAGRNGHSGSGMQAVFLGGPGSTNGLSGTGVFLPRATNNSVQQKKKPGLSTVLIPTRVLEAIELHFKRHSDSGWTAGSGSPQHASLRADEWMASKGQEKVHTMEGLPQEWTY